MNKNKKHLASAQQNPAVLLLMGCVLALIAYGFASWAIDSGSVFVYAAAMLAAYYSVRSVVRALKQLIRK
ncbi:hypothetical protein EB077_04230 [bacterium]|nr:hypothetical protein [bacterium]